MTARARGRADHHRTSISPARYPYTSVVVAQTTALTDAQAALDVKQSQLLAAVSLIEALGGGWETSQLPSRERLNEIAPLDFNPLPPPIARPQPKLW